MKAIWVYALCLRDVQLDIINLERKLSELREQQCALKESLIHGMREQNLKRIENKRLCLAIGLDKRVSVHVRDVGDLPDHLVEIEERPKYKEIIEELESGTVIDGCRLVDDVNVYVSMIGGGDEL